MSNKVHFLHEKTFDILVLKHLTLKIKKRHLSISDIIKNCWVHTTHRDLTDHVRNISVISPNPTYSLGGYSFYKMQHDLTS